MKCPFCEKEISERLNFCTNCGKQISHCPSCGKPILFKSNVCVFCGETLAPSLTIGLPEQNDIHKEKKDRQHRKAVENIPIEKGIERVQIEKTEPEIIVKEKNRREGFDKIGSNKSPNLKLLMGTVVTIVIIGLAVRGIFGIVSTSLPGSGQTVNSDSSNSSKADNVSTMEETFAMAITDEALEKRVEVIREEYNIIMSNYNTGIYEEIIVEDGVSACYDGDELKMIIAAKDTEGIGYTRYYYYNGDELFFTYYEASDALRIYLEDGEIIRIRYTENAFDTENAINYDSADNWDLWPEIIENDNSNLKSKSTDAKSYYDVTAEDYVLPSSSSTFLSASDLTGFSKEKCRIARNEIFARHGRKFDDSILQAYFNAQKWYKGTIDPADFDDSVLNRYERKNVDLIVQYEEDKGYR